jgi:iron complex outermembrane receptor protein
VPEEVGDLPAAVFVITQEDIRRSGATSIPEVLRLAPGVEVARINAGTWSIGIRGFADRLARSMLVLIDGRAVYSPLFAGTYWETQDTLLADIDRIEVIRGPGGTLWGANAVNGIINIITKPASATQGVLLDAGVGSQTRTLLGARYGGTRGRLTYRAYAKGFDRVAEYHPDGSHYDGWKAVQGGFRGDWALGNRSATVQGDIYNARLGERPSVALYTPSFARTVDVHSPLSGGNVVARFASDGPKGALQLQTYYDRTNRDEIPVAENRDTFDIDLQHVVRTLPRQALIWGAGYRVTSGRITAVAPTSFSPPTRTDMLYSVFVQDDFTLVPRRWRITVGSKAEHNDYSGFELQPTARLLWTPDAAQSLFWSVTRAVRTPSRVETDYTTTSLVSAIGTPTFVRLVPNPDFESEKLTAYEFGYRVRPAARLYATFASFYNVLDDTLSTELGTTFVETSPPPARVILPVSFRNGLHGNSYGAETTVDARLAPSWRLTGNYSYLNVSMTPNAGSRDVSQERRYEGLVAHHQWEIGSSWDARGGWMIDGTLRYVSTIQGASIPSYVTANLRVARQLRRQVELALVGQNLFDKRHPEWPSGSGANVEVQRSVSARLTWQR